MTETTGRPEAAALVEAPEASAVDSAAAPVALAVEAAAAVADSPAAEEAADKHIVNKNIMPYNISIERNIYRFTADWRKNVNRKRESIFPRSRH